MAILLRLRGMPTGEETPHDGEFLESMNFEGNKGFGALYTTPSPRNAKKFNSHEEAFRYYRQSPMSRLFRQDGKPNRPMTGFNWEFVKEEDV